MTIEPEVIVITGRETAAELDAIMKRVEEQHRLFGDVSLRCPKGIANRINRHIKTAQIAPRYSRQVERRSLRRGMGAMMERLAARKP